MNPHDSLIVATQIAEARDQIIEAVKASKSYTLKDLAPMIGAICVGLVSAGIAIWSLKRNTNYDREKRTENRRLEMLDTIRKIYGELVALNVQLEHESVSMNSMELSFQYELAKPSEAFIQSEFDKCISEFSKFKQSVNAIKHRYLSLLSEYKFLTDSENISEIIDKLSNLKLRVNRNQDFKGISPIDMFEAYKKILADGTRKTEAIVIELGGDVERIILSEKENFIAKGNKDIK